MADIYLIYTCLFTFTVILDIVLVHTASISYNLKGRLFVVNRAFALPSQTVLFFYAKIYFPSDVVFMWFHHFEIWITLKNHHHHGENSDIQQKIFQIEKLMMELMIKGIYSVLLVWDDNNDICLKGNLAVGNLLANFHTRILCLKLNKRTILNGLTEW